MITKLVIQSKKAACGSFSKHLLNIGDGKVTTDETGCIQLPTDFYTIINSQDAPLTRYFPMYTEKTQIMIGWQNE
jgi:hypothetical protein